MILEKSIKNCHVKGLHSIVLSEGLDGRLTRVYVHEPEGGLRYGSVGLAIHSHKRSLAFDVLGGELCNFTFDIVAKKECDADTNFDSWIWKSPLLTTDKVGFSNMKHRTVLREIGLGAKYHKDQFFFMNAWDLHTVRCAWHEYTSWLIIEGEIDPGYLPFSYSNEDLSKFSTEGLYQPFESGKEIRELFEKAGISDSLF